MQHAACDWHAFTATLSTRLSTRKVLALDANETTSSKQRLRRTPLACELLVLADGKLLLSQLQTLATAVP